MGRLSHSPCAHSRAAHSARALTLPPVLSLGSSLLTRRLALQAQDQITITGYEKNTEAARDAILKIVGELEQMVSEDMPLDHRVHARIIGARGKAVRKIMDEFKVSEGARGQAPHEARASPSLSE